MEEAIKTFPSNTLNYHSAGNTPTAMAEHDTLTITFTDEGEKARAFFELIHSMAQFQGIGRNTFVVSKKDCKTLRDKRIKYREID